jgi:predicted dehydrogenase
MTYRVALIGAGSIAERHAEAIPETGRLKLVGVADLRPERAAELAERHDARPYTDYKEMIKKEKPDIAVITLPHFLHKEAVIHCAGQGCHMLLEKPMALNARECDEMIEAVRRSRVKVLVGHTQHYIAENRKAKQLIESGALGRLVMVNDKRHVHYYRDTRPGWFFEKAKAGGGILTNLGSHSIDKIQWLTGSKISKVRAALSHFGPKGDVEGSGLVFMETDGGVPATIAQSGYGGVPQDETEFIFTDGMLKLMTGQSLWVSDGGKYVEVPVEREDKPFVLQFRDLIDCIESGKEPECGMAYARTVVAAIDAVYLSHELGKEVVVERN